MTKFNWEDYQVRVADYVMGGMDQQSAELQVQHEMEDELNDYDDWVRDMELEEEIVYYGA